MKCRNFREKKIHVNKYKSASQVYKTKNVKKLFRLSKFWGKNHVFFCFSSTIFICFPQNNNHTEAEWWSDYIYKKANRKF